MNKQTQQLNLHIHNFHTNKALLFPMILLILLSLPNEAKCDAGEILSSLILFCLILLVVFAAIGWYSKRGENK